LALLALGSARAQYHLRLCFVYLDMPVVNQPDMIANAAEKFDAHGHLTDDKAKELIGRLLANLCELASRRRPGKLPASFHAPRPGPRRVQLGPRAGAWPIS
jgi:NAD(P)H-dependent FMN reductase